MLRKLLTYEEAKTRQRYYEDKIEQDKVYGLPKDWYGWDEPINVTLLKEPHIKNMPVYVFRSYYLPAWLFEGETYEMFVPSFEVAKIVALVLAFRLVGKAGTVIVNGQNTTHLTTAI